MTDTVVEPLMAQSPSGALHSLNATGFMENASRINATTGWWFQSFRYFIHYIPLWNNPPKLINTLWFYQPEEVAKLHVASGCSCNWPL